MKYLDKWFSVGPGAPRDEEACEHGWTDPRGHCVMCGHVHQWGEETREKVVDIDAIAVKRDCVKWPCRAVHVHYEDE